MKLVIEIDEKYYKFIKYNIEHGSTYKPFVIIANGTPLTENDDCISRKAVLEASSKLCVSDECCKCQFEEDTKCRLKWYKNYIKSLPVSTNTKAISADNGNNTCLKCSYFDDEFKSCAYPSMSVESMCPNELKKCNSTNTDIISKIRTEIKDYIDKCNQLDVHPNNDIIGYIIGKYHNKGE